VPPPAPSKVRITVGGVGRASVALPAGPRRDGARVVELNDPPPGIRLTGSKERGNSIDLELAAAPDAVAGLKGNLIIDLFVERSDPPRPAAGTAPPAPAPPPATAVNPPRAIRRVPLGQLPAIPFEIVTP
jgi:hypothetical protein